jgi:hypothetical protein
VEDEPDIFYVTNLTRASFSEVWQASNRSLVALLILGLYKVTRRTWRCGTPLSLSLPCSVDPSDLPADVLKHMGEPLLQLRDAGFVVIGATHKRFLGINEGYSLELLSEDRLSGCSLMWVRNKNGPQVQEVVVVSMTSLRRQGMIIATSNLVIGFKPPPDVIVQRHPGASATDVRDQHRERISGIGDLVLFNRDSRLQTVEDLAERSSRFNLKRGLYIPATREEIERAMN